MSANMTERQQLSFTAKVAVLKWLEQNRESVAISSPGAVAKKLLEKTGIEVNERTLGRIAEAGGIDMKKRPYHPRRNGPSVDDRIAQLEARLDYLERNLGVRAPEGFGR
jgi:chorismate synthase